MFLEYAENIVQLMACLIALLFCLFQYISGKQKGWVYATAVFLGSLMSSYYWTAYLVIMGDYPNVSNLFSYLGWNVAFVFLLLLVLHMRCAESRRFFHPLMLLPIPLNAWQLSLYLQYGGVLNNLIQVSVTTATACFCLQSILWYRKNRKNGAARPNVAMVALLYILFEYGMWTASCFAAPIGTLYYPFSFLASVIFLALGWALAVTYKSGRDPARDGAIRRYQTILKAVYFSVVLVCSVGGIMLGIWMRDTMRAGLEQASGSNLYDIIHVVLFIISLFLVAFAVTIIYVVRFSEKAAENNELSEARQIAEHSNAAKSEFLANMSHEIRTPINAMLGMNEMILREDRRAQTRPGDSAPPVREALKNIGIYAEDVKNAGHNLLAIINDILDFSKIEAGRIELQETTYQFSSVLNDLSNMFFFKARDKGLEFIMDVDESLPDHLRGDEVRIRQVLTNILSNAVKYTEQGSVRLTVRGERQGDKRLLLTAAVEDTGIGIRPEDEGKLFARFERLDMQRNSTVEGTGLGLVITKRLLDMMGGSISVRSTYGVGSVFTVVIPLGIADDAPIGDYKKRFEASIQEAKPYQEVFRAPDARILIVDDTQMNLNVVVNLLKKTEMQIDTATSGADALALTDEKTYDAILMDQRMPGMNGTETLHQIRARAEGLNRDTPVICLTADAVVGARERYLSDGFADYLSKPIDSQVLERVILKYLPSEKVRMVKGGEQPTEAAATTANAVRMDDYAPLRAAGIDPGIGIGYCQGDEGLYQSLLRDYLQCAEERAEGLARRYDERDWKAYVILAHIVKSSSKTIGAAALSDIAAGLEAAADAGGLAAHQRDHQRLLEKYSVTVAAIRSIIPLPEEKHDDGEIMEFLPE